MDASVSEVYLKLNPVDMSPRYEVSIAPVTITGPGQFSAPVNLSLPADLLPISVQPNLDEAESSAWLVVLLGSLSFMCLLLSSVMFYYRRRKLLSTCSTTAGYLPAAVTDLEFRHGKGGVSGVLWSDRHWESCDSERETVQTSPSLATNLSFNEKTKQTSFETPYATTNVQYDQDRKIKVIHQIFYG